jgi:Rieske Fe-S protein
MSDTTTQTGASRRVVLAGAVAAGAGVALAGCGKDQPAGSGTDPAGGNTSGGNPAGGTTAGGTATGNPATGGATGGQPLARKSDIPPGGGKIFDQEKVVVTQPTEGTFKAFSAICPHMGCTLSSVSGGWINCPCHGSTFSITDGSANNGPATNPLPEKTLKVDGDNLILG